MPTLCVAQVKAVGRGEEGAPVARPTGGVAGRGAHVGDQQDVRQAWTGPGAGPGLWGGGSWNRTVGQEGSRKFGGAARAQEGYEGVQKSGTAPRRVLSRLQGRGIGGIEVDDVASAGTGRPR